MEDSKLFKTIWRFNAIVIAIAGIATVFFLLISLYFVIKEFSQNRRNNEIVNVDPDSNIEEVFKLGKIVHVKGSSAVIVPLYSDQEFSLRYSGSKSTVSTRNLLFTDLRKEKSDWLLPTNQYLIANYRLINENDSYNSNENIITILYQIVKSDTNSDSRLTINDQQTIAFSKPDGSRFTEIIKDVDEVLGYDIIDKRSIAIMFYRDKIGYTAYIDLASFELTKELELPKFN